jgi:MoaA/NifB/PqqE/SkfB family radical SAM enzyme
VGVTVTQRLDQHDKQIAAIRDLMKEGIKMAVETRRVALETRKDLRNLAAMQKRTDASLHALTESMPIGGNGHTKRRLD